MFVRELCNNIKLRVLKKYKFLFLILLLCCPLCMNANEMREVITQEFASDTLEVYFHQGKHKWEPGFKHNGERLEAFVERFKRVRRDSVLYNISKIHIIAGCSPEGTYEYNQRLSKNRAREIRNVLKRYITLPDSVIKEESRGINWEGLYNLVEASDMEHRDTILHIMNISPELYEINGVMKELRKIRLIWLKDGKPWKYMYEHFFPQLRSFNLQIVIEWEKVTQYMDLKPVSASVETITVPTPELPVITPKPIQMPEIAKVDELPPFYMALKTNMLYDVALVPNIGVEMYLGKKFSVAANWMYSWWKSDTKHNYWRTYGGDLEVRRYFGKKAEEKPLQGFHAGVYAQMLTYDFELGNRGYLGDRWTWGGGLSLGYSLPVKRRLNLDFTLGLGYLGGEYKEYLPIDGCYVWQVTKQRNWFGPTKLEVSLVWLLGRGNYNVQKGGEK